MADKKVLVADSITVGELAETLHLQVSTLVGELFKNGIVATINQKIDFDTAQIIVEELGIDVVLERKKPVEIVRVKHENSEKAEPRPPIVAVMGHVDHGKTTLLDQILKMHKVSTEAGGITQHISAYQTERNGKKITLLDTPGHEAFAALRQHGAVLTDVVIIVVAADDGVKPQTVEAIKFAQNANAKIVVAINKIDKPTANPEMVKAQLASEYKLTPEEWGGDVLMVNVSALTGEGIDKLLDAVLLVAEMEELKADYDIPAEGLVIESHMEQGRGSVVSLLVEQGTIHESDVLVAGTAYGKIRTLLDFKGDRIKKAGPSTPVTITGLKDLPQFGDSFVITKNERLARKMVTEAKIEHEKNAASTNVTGADLLKMMSHQDDVKDFDVVVKADVQGSLTSVVDSLKMINGDEEVNVRVIGTGVGNISENDIRLAMSGNTVVYGFNVELPPNVKRLAQRDRVEVRIFKVIYELIDDVKASMSNLLSPKIVDETVAELDVKGVFKTTKDEVIAGGEILSGKVVLADKPLVRFMRKKEVLGEGELINIQKQKHDVKELFESDICGFSVKVQNRINLEVGDKVQFFKRELVKREIK
ncbi:translation initiation factor IF-2 [TM7 phylum sp. oral taxon 350]|nr:translation initiation factor IF-2 [TM7 phylum sp. oral taxon 350]